MFGAGRVVTLVMFYLPPDWPQCHVCRVNEYKHHQKPPSQQKTAMVSHAAVKWKFPESLRA